MDFGTRSRGQKQIVSLGHKNNNSMDQIIETKHFEQVGNKCYYL